jgi:hypothetical protein
VASVLSSARAINISVYVVRAFVELRETLARQKTLAHKLTELERKIKKHDEEIESIFNAIRQLMKPAEPTRRKIGFLMKERAARYGKRGR